jgi:hypothetical protein
MRHMVWAIAFGAHFGNCLAQPFDRPPGYGFSGDLRAHMRADVAALDRRSLCDCIQAQVDDYYSSINPDLSHVGPDLSRVGTDMTAVRAR